MEPDGISAYMDWALMVPCLFGNMSSPPRSIFVHNHMLPHFVESTLHFMDPTYRFVLVTGGTDMTVPRQTDSRYRQAFRGFGGNDGGRFYQILVESPQIIHWFAENHDLTHPKVSTLPTGMSTGFNPDDRTDFPWNISIPILQRPMKVLVSDRVRSGTGQWALRREVKDECEKVKASICEVPSDIGGEGIAKKDYMKLLSSIPFIACVRGGGLDPSPKAWEAIIVGTIPIIQSNWLDDGYKRLPLVIIEDWRTIFNETKSGGELQAQLLSWAKWLAPFYEEHHILRMLMLERLKTKFWLHLIDKKIDQYDQEHNVSFPHRPFFPAESTTMVHEGSIPPGVRGYTNSTASKINTSRHLLRQQRRSLHEEPSNTITHGNENTNGIADPLKQRHVHLPEHLAIFVKQDGETIVPSLYHSHEYQVTVATNKR